MQKVQIKICGLTGIADAEAVHAAGAEYGGVVLFYPASRRNVSIQRGRDIAESLRKNGVTPVAVVVSPTAEQAREAANAGFSYLQVHGQLPKQLLADPPIPLLRACYMEQLKDGTAGMLCSCDGVAGIVLDNREPGSGKTICWEEALPYRQAISRLILAGGLNAENVQEAIQILHPDVVDVSSSVEEKSSQPGEIPHKDAKKIQQFAAAVRSRKGE